MASIIVDATASLSATGTTVSTGTLSWAVPSFPEDVTVWDDIIVSGMFSWTGKGNVTVTINGKTISSGQTFSISLGDLASSPYTISCKSNNKNAVGNYFSWTNLKITYQYTPAKIFYFKDVSTWIEATSVFKKVNGAWELQDNLATVIDDTKKYVRGD